MDNKTEKTIETRSSKLEDKQSEISHKVWEQNRENFKLKINSNGTIPPGLDRKMSSGTLYTTNYVSDHKPVLLIKIDGIIYKLLAEKT